MMIPMHAAHDLGMQLLPPLTTLLGFSASTLQTVQFSLMTLIVLFAGAYAALDVSHAAPGESSELAGFVRVGVYAVTAAIGSLILLVYPITILNAIAASFFPAVPYK